MPVIYLLDTNVCVAYLRGRLGTPLKAKGRGTGLVSSVQWQRMGVALLNPCVFARGRVNLSRMLANAGRPLSSVQWQRALRVSAAVRQRVSRSGHIVRDGLPRSHAVPRSINPEIGCGWP